MQKWKQYWLEHKKEIMKINNVLIGEEKEMGCEEQ